MHPIRQSVIATIWFGESAYCAPPLGAPSRARSLCSNAGRESLARTRSRDTSPTGCLAVRRQRTLSRRLIYTALSHLDPSTAAAPNYCLTSINYWQPIWWVMGDLSLVFGRWLMALYIKVKGDANWYSLTLSRLSWRMFARCSAYYFDFLQD